jgi:hypothetical protein
MSEPRRNDAGTREPARQTPRPADGARPAPPGRAVRSGGVPGTGGPSRSGVSPRWGQLPWGRGVVFVAAAAGLGALLTIFMGSDPGLLLGLLVVAGTVAASLAVSPRRAYLIIPAPALAYLAAAILAGLIHDWTSDTSHALLALNAARWSASGFLGMLAATALAVVITVARWLRSGRAARLPPAGGNRPTAPPGRPQEEREANRPRWRSPR